jgi:hypothetical protein
MELKRLKFGKEWIDDLNLRSGGATRRKRSTIGWEYGYSRLLGGIPHLCQLRTICSGPWNEHLIMY